jgi:hypothetical protein
MPWCHLVHVGRGTLRIDWAFEFSCVSLLYDALSFAMACVLEEAEHCPSLFSSCSTLSSVLINYKWHTDWERPKLFSTSLACNLFGSHQSPWRLDRRTASRGVCLSWPVWPLFLKPYRSTRSAREVLARLWLEFVLSKQPLLPPSSPRIRHPSWGLSLFPWCSFGVIRSFYVLLPF